MSVNPPRFEPQGSYFDQYPDRRTRLNSYAAPIPTHSKTPAESTITTPRRAGLSSRGPVNLASELSQTSFAHRFSSSPQAPPADLALLQRARRGSANGASSFNSDPSASPLSLSSLERPKPPITSPSEASIYRAFTSESSRRRLSIPSCILGEAISTAEQVDQQSGPRFDESYPRERHPDDDFDVNIPSFHAN
ncbi:BQ5605_C008g05075 [Microbotryum silenes-dioicae]|uniref:BQ5605_C008g05075 protein n=1 Tax=Microbotryum silenes-dioicae TaxID=796604 RepID=A0A2X0MZ14_9BASI|nr:BQ5605_C008g05075 [Microbotryum silenes-dioicae]